MTFEEWAADCVMSGMEREFARDAWMAATKAEREACWGAINAAIKPGDLPGDGTDKIAERNGLILASNIVMERMHSNDQVVRRGAAGGASALTQKRGRC